MTPQNEERQLRLALGQVLRYAQQLAYKDKPIRKVIAIERRPTDTTWIQLFGRYDVMLVWPETFRDITGGAAGAARLHDR